MASTSFSFINSSASSLPATLSNGTQTAPLTVRPRQVPLSRRQGVSNFQTLLNRTREYDLGQEVYIDLSSKGKQLVRKVKPILVRLAADDDGGFRKTWKELSTTRCNLMNQAVYKVVP